MTTTAQKREATVSPSRPVRLATLAWWATIAVQVAFLTTFTTAENRPVMLPIVVTVGAITLFSWVLWLRQRTIPIFEIGMIYVAVIGLYTLYPLAGFIINGLTYTPFNDNRLFYAKPTPDEIGLIGWHYTVHLVSFILIYLLARGRLPRKPTSFPRPDQTTLFILVGLYVAIIVFFLILNFAVGLGKSSYTESYVISRSLPFGWAQLASLLGGVRFTLEVAILAVLFFHHRKYWPLILAWLGLVTLATSVRLGSRTELVLLTLSAAMMYHYLVRPIPLRLAAVGGILVLALFISLGLLRMGWLFYGTTTYLNPFAYASEFEVIFGNAFDLYHRLAVEAINLPPGFYLSDLVIMIPRQFLPFAKISPADWYVTTFYPAYAAQGGGLALGTITESILGGGWLDTMIRGAALGFILAKIHRYHMLHRLTFWMFVFYVWLAMQMYHSFRNTTFFPLYLFVYRFLWIVVFVEIIAMFLKGSVSARSRTHSNLAHL